jgi:hypothetical protein
MVCKVCNEVAKRIQSKKQEICSRCYQKRRKALLPKKPPRIKYTECIECEVPFTEIKHQGKGMCARCYRRHLLDFKNCITCGIKLFGKSKHGLCRVCKAESGITQTRRKPIIIEPETIQQIKLLLIRVKHGLHNDIDIFLILNLHLECCGYQTLFDNYSPDYQAYLMLKELKNIYEKNKHLIYETNKESEEL